MDEYRNESVLFIEQNVDAPVGRRLDRWFAGYGQSGDVELPLVMVDSGNEVSNGDEDFDTVYRSMVDDSQVRPTKAQMVASSEQEENLLIIDVRLTNTSGVSLSSANDATLTALVWESTANPATVPIVRRVRTAGLPTMHHGDTRNFTLEVPVTNLNPNQIRWVVIADYQPDEDSDAYDTLQAVQGP